MQLVPGARASVDLAAAEVGAAAELPRLVVDLDDELPGGRHDDHLRRGLHPVLPRGPSAQQLVDHGEEECGGLARASLGTGHQIPTLLTEEERGLIKHTIKLRGQKDVKSHCSRYKKTTIYLDDWNSILLNRCWHLVGGASNVAGQQGSETSLIEGVKGPVMVIV